VTPAEALEQIREYASAGSVVFTRHARLRMDERGAMAWDVVHALANASHCQAGEDDRWKATGVDLDGDELTAVVVLEGEVVVVTVF